LTQALRLGMPLPRTNSPPPEPPGGPVNQPGPTRPYRPANPVAPPDHHPSCKDVASMFLGCSLLVSSFLVPPFTPSWPPSRHSRHAETPGLRPGLLPSAWAPIQSCRPASPQPTISPPNIETVPALSRLQQSPPSAFRLNSGRGARTALSPFGTRIRPNRDDLVSTSIYQRRSHWSSGARRLETTVSKILAEKSKKAVDNCVLVY
jgi:hypothetical protein